MATREALRELQARLAKRLQAAQTEGMSVAWLAVRAGGHNYLLPLGQAGEIVPMPPLQRVPYTRAWFEGVLNVRGSLYGLVDLAAFIAANQGPAVVPAPSRQDASVVTLNAALEVNCALRVDSLAGLRGNDAYASISAPVAGAPPFFGNCFLDAEGQRWQELNLQALAQFPPFLHIGI
jgi:twitching motility protein PilI